MTDGPIRRAPEVPLDATEAHFERVVLEVAALYGWRRHHGRPARTAKGWRTPVAGETGFPDLVLARRGVVQFVELKTETKNASEEQKAWLSALAGVTPEDDWASRGPLPTLARSGSHYVALWRPRHWEYVKSHLQAYKNAEGAV